jgi:hypothetical protein
VLKPVARRGARRNAFRRGIIAHRVRPDALCNRGQRMLINCVLYQQGKKIRDANFSDRGRLFQSDRVRRFSVIVDGVSC